MVGWPARWRRLVDAGEFQRVYEAFEEFHSFFAPAFSRKQWREHSRNYLQALLVQSQERRNAGNLSESVGVSARAMQRFLTEARWDDDRVISCLQEYLAPKLGHPEGVWVLDGSDFPKQGRKSAGVARQYCGRLGKVANCQAGMFLAYVSPHNILKELPSSTHFDFLHGSIKDTKLHRVQTVALPAKSVQPEHPRKNSRPSRPPRGYPRAKPRSSPRRIRSRSRLREQTIAGSSGSRKGPNRSEPR